MRLFVLPLTLLVACTIDHSGLVSADGDRADAFIPDAASADVTRFDVGGRDSGGRDSGGRDSGPIMFDAGNDAGPIAFDAGNDAGPFDAGNDVGGFDAGNDAGPVDPCTIGPDSDSDGVRDNCDVCDGFDDNADDDGDGIADGCDDWPCGMRPTVPSVVERDHVRVEDVNIHDMGNTAVVRRDEVFEIAFDWNVGDEGCPGCIRQLEWGFDRIGRLGCVYDDNPPSSGASGSALISNIPIPPSAAGLYQLRFNLGQEYACDDIDNWHGGSTPPATQTFGVVCVPPPGIAMPSAL